VKTAAPEVLRLRKLGKHYGKTVVLKGVDLSVAQKLVGHSDPKTTARYDRRGKGAERKAAEMLEDPT